ncbi:MAG: DUF4007 family protein [candidate division Zixibacteria bacterium]|nr:DUF4007 family protein [candidate division Zixibacteria bacterium]
MGNFDKYRFSGHETFPFRYAWLPKAFSTIQEYPKIFSDENTAMVKLGVGKNMVRAIRFWAEVTNIIDKLRTGGWEVTPFGRSLFNKNGFDPFLEDSQTFWLLHWKLSTQFSEPLFAWDYLLNRWHDSEFSKSAVMITFEQECNRIGKKLSSTTLAHHFDTFVHTYLPTRGVKAKIREENLDCPLTELEILVRVGDRQIDDEAGKREPIYAFRFETKPEISPELFAYSIADYFIRKHPTEFTLPFREIAVGHGSPGQVFKLPEIGIRERLENLHQYSRGLLIYDESANIQQIRRKNDLQLSLLLESIYKREFSYA